MHWLRDLMEKKKSLWVGAFLQNTDAGCYQFHYFLFLYTPLMAQIPGRNIGQARWQVSTALSNLPPAALLII